MKNQLQKQEPAHLKINLFFLTIGFLIAIITMLVIWLLNEMPNKVFYPVVIGLCILYVIMFLYLKAFYKNFSYYMDERGLFINKGVFWKHKIVVPINRVQHTDITQGPIARKYDLAELTVHTAGTTNSSVKIEGILIDNASELRSQLSFNESEDAV